MVWLVWVCCDYLFAIVVLLPDLVVWLLGVDFLIFVGFCYVVVGSSVDTGFVLILLVALV